ncbi:MAG: hypothetical protein EZS28_013584 [Streblomastix strix]|uniref:Peptidase C14 caspase domain-containing protein n=1 Tax=Streblomastix strix TaxID=222440 RepID=A0A5J4W970_9EUKA|nr:MAG: hypothetical protein EZS28_013584 [Streblomastix strix]
MGLTKDERIQSYQQPVTDLTAGRKLYDDAIAEDYYIPPTSLPTQFVQIDAEIKEQKKRWAELAAFMSKPFKYNSLFQQQHLELDSLGAINLERTTREQIPGLQINYCCAMFINPYEGDQHSLGSEPLIEYYRWMSWLIDNVDLQLVSYFSGRTTQIKDYTGMERDGLLEVLQFANNFKKCQKSGVFSVSKIDGITNETLEDTVVYQLIRSKEYPQKRIILLTDYRYNFNQFKDEIPFQKLQFLYPLPNVIYIGSSQIWTAERQATVTKPQSNNPGLFSQYFSQVLKSTPNANFNLLYSELSQPKCQSQWLQIFTGDATWLQRQIIVTMGKDDEELQLATITPHLQGKTVAQIISIPAVDIPSKVEFQAAKERWGHFTSELKKPALYQSKFKDKLIRLDQMGCINLERRKREQIPPNILIENCAALFSNQYEGLPHTLDDGPVNDALLMADLFLNNGYNVVYTCDSTPHNYYKWIYWLLTNVKKELVSFFSGHGTQVPDKTGKEKDGLSEVLVFNNAKKKKSPGEKITPVKGITDETVEDTVMHDLIVSKDYPNTRVVLLTDCCHSGTMFNFDQPIPANDKLNAPHSKRISVVCVGAAVDSQTAKQNVQWSVEYGRLGCILFKKHQEISDDSTYSK